MRRGGRGALNLVSNSRIGSNSRHTEIINPEATREGSLHSDDGEHMMGLAMHHRSFDKFKISDTFYKKKLTFK